MSAISDNLQRLEIDLPAVSAPAANYVSYTIIDKIVSISGQLPMKNGTPQFVGKVGETISDEEAKDCARLCAINILAQLKDACGGDWEKLDRCIRLGVFVNATPNYTAHPQVANGASDLMVEVLGVQGEHARAAVGVGSLPFGVAVEVEASFKLV